MIDLTEPQDQSKVEQPVLQPVHHREEVGLAETLGWAAILGARGRLAAVYRALQLVLSLLETQKIFNMNLSRSTMKPQKRYTSWASTVLP